MSLLSEALEECTILDKKTVNDGYGGFISEWEDGATFEAAITFNSSLQAKVAEKQGVTSLYSVITSRTVILKFNDYFRRERDGKLFRVTSDGDDVFTPQSASLDMRQVDAEEIKALPR